MVLIRRGRECRRSTAGYRYWHRCLAACSGLVGPNTKAAPLGRQRHQAKAVTQKRKILIFVISTIIPKLRLRSEKETYAESFSGSITVNHGRRVKVKIRVDDVGGIGYSAARGRVQVVTTRVLGCWCDAWRSAISARVAGSVRRVRRVGHL